MAVRIDLHRHYHRFAVLPALFALLAAALVLVRQIGFGPGLSPDSAAYISVARSLRDGAFHAYYGSLDCYPPLYPIVLGLVGAWAKDLIAVAALVNAAAFGATVFVLVRWLLHSGASVFLAAWLGLAAVLSLDVANVAAYVLSEALFMLLAVLALWFLRGYLESRTRRAFLLAAACAGLCCLTRYLGVAVVVGALTVLALDGALSRVAREVWRGLRRVAAYAAVALTPVLLWLSWHPLPVAGFLGGEDARCVTGELSALGDIDTWVRTVLAWGLGPTLAELADIHTQHPVLNVALKVIVLFSLCGAGGYALFRRLRREDWHHVLLPGAFVVAYFSLLGLIGLFRYVEPRYFAPAHLPFLLLVALGVGALSRTVPSRVVPPVLAAWWRHRTPRSEPKVAWWTAPGVGRLAGMAFLVLWLGQWLVPNWKDVAGWIAQGKDGYGNRRWAETQSLHDLPLSAWADGPLFASDSMATYLLATPGRRNGPADIRPLDSIPFHLYAEGDRAARPGKLGKSPDYGKRHFHVLWLHNTFLSDAGDLMPFLQSYPMLDVVRVYGDGILFRFERERHETAKDVTAQLADTLLAGVRGRRPLRGGGFDVYVDPQTKRLTYLREECVPAHTRPRFILHITPEEPHVLAPDAAFDNRDFSFSRRGLLYATKCFATASLPAYPIAGLRTGQWDETTGTELWSVHWTP